MTFRVQEDANIVFSIQRVTIMARVKDLGRYLLIEMCRQEVETALASQGFLVCGCKRC